MESGGNSPRSATGFTLNQPQAHHWRSVTSVPGNKWSGVGLAERWDYIGSLFVVGDAITGTLRASLEAALADIMEKQPDQAVLGGVSQPAASGLVVKLVSQSAPAMTLALAELWGAVRGLLWQLPPLALRKY
jgi:urease accessory protein UreH